MSFLSDISQFLEVENGNYVPCYKFSIFLGGESSHCRLKGSAKVYTGMCVPVCQSYMVLPSACLSVNMDAVRATSC